MNKEDYSKYYIQGSDHYLIPKDVFDELFNEMSNWRDEAKELKKQLEKCYCNRTDCSGRIKGSKTYDSLEQKIKNQQKEFIEYLEDKICIADKVLDEPEEDEEVRGYVLARKFMLEEILSKYKEIIGEKKYSYLNQNVQEKRD